jgi:Sec-independent protein translocase protein TatA
MGGGMWIWTVIAVLVVVLLVVGINKLSRKQSWAHDLPEK